MTTREALEQLVKAVRDKLPAIWRDQLREEIESAESVLFDEALRDGHPKMVELRDQAIDELRAGNCLPMEEPTRRAPSREEGT